MRDTRPGMMSSLHMILELSASHPVLYELGGVGVSRVRGAGSGNIAYMCTGQKTVQVDFLFFVKLSLEDTKGSRGAVEVL
jgi:hypothetical protein